MSDVADSQFCHLRFSRTIRMSFYIEALMKAWFGMGRLLNLSIACMIHLLPVVHDADVDLQCLDNLGP